MDRLLDAFSRFACGRGRPPRDDTPATPPASSRSPFTVALPSTDIDRVSPSSLAQMPEPQAPSGPTPATPDAPSHLGHLQNILRAHLHRARPEAEAQVLDWKYDGFWDAEENARQVLRAGPEVLRATGLPAAALATPGPGPLPADLHPVHAELLRSLMAAGLDLCTVRRIPLDTAWGLLQTYANEACDLRRGRGTDGYDAAYHRIASRYLQGLVQARACERKLRRSLEHLYDEHGSLANLCPASASAVHLQNYRDTLHLLANHAPAYFFHEDIEHFYRQRRDDGTWYGLEGALRHHEVDHPGSTAAATLAMSLVLDKLVEGQGITLAWLDGVRDSLAACMPLAGAPPLCSPPAAGAAPVAAQVKALLAQYQAAIDAGPPDDIGSVYRAIAELCCSLYRLQPCGEDLGLVSTAVLQYLLLHHGLPVVPQQQPHLLSQPADAVAALLEAGTARQRALVAALEPRHLQRGGADLRANASAQRRPAACLSAR